MPACLTTLCPYPAHDTSIVLPLTPGPSTYCSSHLIIIIIIEGLSLLQSIPPTTADKQTQAQKRRGSSSHLHTPYYHVTHYYRTPYYHVTHYYRTPYYHVTHYYRTPYYRVTHYNRTPYYHVTHCYRTYKIQEWDACTKSHALK